MSKKRGIVLAVVATGLLGAGVVIGVVAGSIASGSPSPSVPGAAMTHDGMGYDGPMGAHSMVGGAGPGPLAQHNGMMGTGGMGGSGMGAMGMDVGDEFGYLTEMIPHHEEAISTATLVAASTTHPELKALAENIVTTQTEQVAQMKAWLAAWYPGRDTSVRYTPMMRDLRDLSGDARDRVFLEDMVPHHGWAVMSSQQVLGRGLAQHPQVGPFATDIRDSQATQIHTMLGMLSSWFNESPMAIMAGHMAHS